MSNLTNEDLNNVLVLLNTKVAFDNLSEAKVGVILEQHVRAELDARNEEDVKKAEAKKINQTESTEDVAVPGEE